MGLVRPRGAPSLTARDTTITWVQQQGLRAVADATLCPAAPTARHRCIHALEHGAAVHAFQWDGGWRLASGTWDGRTMLWDMQSGRKVKEWRSHCEERVWAIAMDDYHIVSAGLDSNVCVRSFLPEDLRFGLWAPEQGAG